jgi:hypothetical protein
MVGSSFWHAEHQSALMMATVGRLAFGVLAKAGNVIMAASARKLKTIPMRRTLLFVLICSYPPKWLSKFPSSLVAQTD